MSERQLPLVAHESFDDLRRRNLQEKGLIPNPDKYPHAGRENRMPNQFGESFAGKGENAVRQEVMLPRLEYSLFEQ